MRTVGLDATKGGWVAVSLVDGVFEAAVTVRDAPSAVARWPDAVAIGIDIPLGLLDAHREADGAARRALGPRGSTVFTTPCASALAQETLADAIRTQREHLGVGLSAQSFALKERMLDAARVGADPRVHEMHPELVFLRLAGGAPLPRKKGWNGQHRRRVLLAAAGVTLPDLLPDAGDAPVDDVLDAAAVALAAFDVLHDRSPRYPDAPTQRDAGGRLVCIRG
jgi:predicted RNase H-like nuclease